MITSIKHSLTGNPAKRISIRRRVVSLSLPVLLSALFQRLVSIVDIFLVGGLGAPAIAAAGLGQFMIFAAMTVFWGLSTGTTVVIAHLWGAERREEARRAALVALLACLILILFATIAGVAGGSRVALFMGAGPDVMAHAAPYIRLVFLWFGFTAGLNILSGIMHGRGDTKTPMTAIMLVNVLHVLMAWPLIYGKFGLPRLGVIGAAYAINLSEAIGFCYLLVRALQLRVISFDRPDWQLWQRIWRVGYPVALERVAQQSGQLLYSRFILGFGTVAYAAHQVGLSIESLSFMPGAGMGIAAATLMGQSLGARKYRQARMGHREAMRLALLVMGLMATLFLLLPEQMMRLFTADSEVIREGVVFLRLVALAQIPLALSFVYAGSLRGTGDTFYVFIATLLTMWGVRVVLAWLVADVFQLSLYFVWGVFVIDWWVRAGAFAWRYHKRDLHSGVL
ncbi:MAG: MATE family efflux transporter [Geobacter sp.]|nr:MATE family efflux transporter [Geobacter sp.]